MRHNTRYAANAESLKEIENDNSWQPTSDLEVGLQMIRNRKVIYDRYSNYYDGNHDLRISVQKMRNTFGYLFAEFADNLCPTVVDSMAERLEVIGFDLESNENDKIIMPIHGMSFEPEIDITNNNSNSVPLNKNQTTIENGTVNVSEIQLPKKQVTKADRAWQLWRECRMKQIQYQVHQESLICGDSYILIWTDPKNSNNICAHPQKASQFYIEDDPESPNNPLYGIKAWQEGKRWRVTLYYFDRLEKYISVDKRNDPKKDEDFEEYHAGDEEWPLPNPYNRVPAFRFSHKSRMGSMGKSELKDMLPIQDALNKALMDLMVAMEVAAQRQRWATGIEVEKDPLTGEEATPFESGDYKLWHTANDSAKFGEFESADLKSFIEVHDSLRLEIARVSRTPLHYFTIQTGNAPSGAALRTIEKPLTDKCESSQTEFGDVWEDVAEFMLLVKGEIFNLGKSQLETTWKPARSEDEKEDLETAVLKKSVGITDRVIQKELGYSDQDIMKMELEKAANDKNDNLQNTQDVLTAFDRGTSSGSKFGGDS